MRIDSILSLLPILFLFAHGQSSHPNDWFTSTGKAKFDCDGVGQNATSYKWFQVLYGFIVFPIFADNKHYRVSNSVLTVEESKPLDRDFFCEAKSPRGRWRSRKAQLRFGAGPSDSKTTTLEVTALNTPVVQKAFDGDILHLACGFPGEPRVQWLHNGSTIGVSDKARRVDTRPHKSVLYILRFDSEQHSGFYQCMVEKHDGSWRPLRKPYLVPPSKKTDTRPDLPFLDFEIITAGEVVMNTDNEHVPRITSVKGLRFKVNINETSDVVPLTSVVVSDLDRGQAGRVTCNVTCGRNASCPIFNETTVDVNPAIGSLLFNASTAAAKLEPLEFNLTCTDRGPDPKSSSASFTVTFVRNKVEAFEESRFTRKLVKMGTTSLKNKTLPDTLFFVERLTDITSEADQFSAVDVTLASAKTVEVIEILDRKTKSKSEKISDAMLKQVTRLVSNTLKVDKKVMANSEDTGSVASQMLSTVDKLIDSINVNDSVEGRKNFTSDKLAVGAAVIDRDRQRSSEIAFGSASDDPKEAAISNSTEGRVAISLRLDQVVGDRVAFAMFRDAHLFEAIGQDNKTRVLSPVISARAALKRFTGEDAVKLSFSSDNLPKDQEDDAARFCAFWNTRNRSWDTQGCNSSLDGRATVCYCSHLTNFALLLDLDARPVSSEHNLALSFLTYFCLTLSCVALVFTVLIYFTYMQRKQASTRAGQKSSASAVTRSRILMSLSGALFAAHLIFLVTSFHNYAGEACKAIAMLLHFFYLSVFFWSVVEGLNIFLSTIYMALNSGRLVLHIASFFTKAAVVAWSLAAVIVIVTAGSTRLHGYGPLYAGVEGAADMSLCFLSGGLPLFLSFVMPLALCLAANVVILSLLGFVLMRRSGGLSAKKKSRSKTKAIGFLSVCVTLNVTWAIGFLHVGPVKVVMNYLFVICNGLQGVLIFVFYCLLREEMRSHMAKRFRCFSWIERGREDSTATSSMPLTSSTGDRRKSSVASIGFRRRKSTTTSST